MLVLFPLLLSLIVFSFEKISNDMAITEMASFPLKAVKNNLLMILKPQDPIDAMGQKAYNSLPIISQDSLELATRHRFSLAVSEVLYKFLKSANLLLLLFPLGFWKRKKQKLENSDFYLLIVFSILTLTSIFYTFRIFYFSTRHGLTLVLPCLFFAGHGVEAAVGILSRRMERLGSGWAVIRRYLPIILTLVLILVFLSQGLGAKGKEKTTIKEIGLWLKQNGYQGSVIMGQKKFLRLAYYADGSFIEMPASWEKAMESIRKKVARIVIVDSCTIEQDCPGLLINLPQTELFLLGGPLGKEGKCQIQIYAGQ